MSTVVLVGGGPDTTRSTSCVAPFVQACTQRNVERIGLLLAGDAPTAGRYAPDYDGLLASAGAQVETVPLGEGPGDLARFGAIVVGGGPTPLYWSELEASMPLIGELVGAGVPYLGFSAGAMVAGTEAIVGGYRSGGIEVCPVDASENLDALTLRPGLGLVPGAVEVHAAQDGTLGRAIAAVASGAAASAVALDEDTSVELGPDGVPHVHGTGQAWWVHPSESGATVTAATVTAQRRGTPGPPWFVPHTG